MIEKIYCINLNERPDRWQRVQEEIKKMDFNVERFQAIIETTGFMGCKRSHLEVLKLCWSYKCFMILEDDVFFMPGAKENLKKAILQLPYNWDMLYLGVNPQKRLKKFSENLYIAKNSWTTHAMIFNNQHNIVDYIIENAGRERKIDVLYANLIQEKFKCFVTFPLVATQYNSISNIVKGKVDYYNTIINGFKKFTK